MSRTLDIPTAEVFEPLLDDSLRYKGAKGGRSSAKSNFFADQLCEEFVRNPATRFLCVREIQKSLEQSVKQLIEDKIKKHSLGYLLRVMHSHLETDAGGRVMFEGMQNHTVDSIKSMEGLDRVWIEEAQSISANSLKILRPTMRKSGSQIWASWNPQNDDDPIEKLLCGAIPPPRTRVVHATFKDNPWFPEESRLEMEWDRQVDYENYEHVWEGAHEKHSEARVFKNWREEAFETPPNTIFYAGADWGFSVDPSTLVRCFVQTHDPVSGKPWPRERLYIDQDLYRIGVEIDHIPQFFDEMLGGIMRNQRIVADSARPETISYLRRHGYPGVEPAKKGAGSVREGVIFLQGFDIIIHPRCKHALKEFKGFSYIVDKKTNQVTNVLQDKKNHIIDPMRYALEQMRGVIRQRATGGF